MKPGTAIQRITNLGVFILMGTAVAFVASGCSKKQCENDKDCPKKTACLQGKCVSLTGGPPPKGPNPFQRRPMRRPGKPDPNAVYRVDVDPKKQPTKGPADALVTLVEFSEFQ